MQVPRARSRRIWPNSHITSRSTSEEVGSSSSSTVGIVVDRPHDLDDLPLGERDLLDQRQRVDMLDAEAATAAPRPRARAAAVDQRGPIKPTRPRGSRPISRFSATVIHGNSVSSWNTVQMPSRWASSGAANATGPCP